MFKQHDNDDTRAPNRLTTLCKLLAKSSNGQQNRILNACCPLYWSSSTISISAGYLCCGPVAVRPPAVPPTPGHFGSQPNTRRLGNQWINNRQHIYTYVRIHIYISTYDYIYVYICTHVYHETYMYIYMFVNIYIYIYIYILQAHIYIYICIYIERCMQYKYM